jgi:alpha,alpha-trehalase
MDEATRATVARLAALCPVAIVSGRGRPDVERLVGLPGLTYAGSHGFDIAGPGGHLGSHGAGEGLEPVIGAAEAELRAELDGIPGLLIENKRFAIAVHYRLVDPAEVGRITAVADRVVAGHPELRRAGGKMIVELRPAIPWDKGRAVLWLLEAMRLDGPDVTPFYLGDDETDRDAFAALRGRGISLFVGAAEEAEAADYVVPDPAAARRFLDALATRLSAGHGRGAP